MTRLVLHTGRFRDMGYETAFSGSDPTTSERADAERLLAALRRGNSEGGVGVVFQISSTGRGVEEALAILLARPLTPEAMALVKAELEALHRDALPGLLMAAGRASSVTEARSVLRRGLDEWTTRLAPLLAFAPQAKSMHSSVTRPVSTMPPSWGLWASAALTVAIISAGASIWYPSETRFIATAPQVSGPSSCRPNGAEDDGEFERLRRAVEESVGRELARGDPFAALNPNSGAQVQLLLPDSPRDPEICEMKRALAQVRRDLSIILDALQPAQLSQARQAMWDGADMRILEALERISVLEIPASDALCTDQNRPCVPWFSEADESVLEALLGAYDAVSLEAQAAADVRGIPFLDMATFEHALASTTFRSGEITLRGELHRAGLGGHASDLLDPILSLVDCPRPGECVAHAARVLRLKDAD